MNQIPYSNASGYTAHNTVQLVRGGSPYFTLLIQLIDRAKESIHLQVYIYEDDETGKLVTNALVRAAQRSVKVYMLLDGYASRSISDETISAILKAGIHFRWFVPLLKGRNFYVGRRMHHKIFVADGLFSLVGGINISNHYNDMLNKPGWLDWAVFAKGEASTELYNRCMQMWFRGSSEMMLSFPQTSTRENTDCFVSMRINDWVLNKNQISRSYLEMFHRAQSHITIMSSYFLPGRVFRKNIRQAAKRGVKIRIILTKISDIRLAKLAERFFYPWLLKRGIEVFEYREKVVHGKIATYDGQWVTVGSYNINNISAYASIELNLDILNQPFSHQIDEALEMIINSDCDQITTKSFTHKTSIWDRMIHRLAYSIVRLLFFLFTFYFKQEKS